MTDALLAGDLPLPPRPDYLRHGTTLRSWLTTTDHKRIAILYAITITVFFFIGGDRDHAGAAGAVHAERRAAHLRHLQQAVLVPRHRHGVVLPDAVHPGHARQFPAAADDRRARRGVSPAQSVQLVSDNRRRRLHALRPDRRRRRHGLDLLYALFDDVLQQPRPGRRGRRVRRRLRAASPPASISSPRSTCCAPGHDLVSAAAVRLGDLRDRHHHGAGDAGAGDHAAAGDRGALVRPADLRSRQWRRSDAVPAPVLVLLPPGRLHHDTAGDGRGIGDHSLLRAPARSSATTSWSMR